MGQYADYGGGNTEFRDIPTDGRARTAEKEFESTYYGYSIGKWEGDTLVIDSTSFTDATWLGRGGLFHSVDMHIIEKLTRVGNEIRYDMTIEDPDSFIEPWVMPTRILRQGGQSAAVAPAAATELFRNAPIAKCTKQAASPLSFATNRSLVTRPAARFGVHSGTGCFLSGEMQNCEVCEEGVAWWGRRFRLPFSVIKRRLWILGSPKLRG